MTSSPIPQNSPVPRVRVSEPGDLVAALPAMLGFHPERSIVVISLSHDQPRRVSAVMRHDLVVRPGRVHVSVRAAISQFSSVCVRDGAAAAILVLVDDRAETGTRPAMYAAVAREFHNALASAGIEVEMALLANDIGPTGTWSTLLGTFFAGAVSDPTASQVAAHRVLDGRAILGSRDELAYVLRRAERRVCEKTAEAIDDLAASTATLARQKKKKQPSAGVDSHDGLVRVLNAVDAVADGDVLEPNDVARLSLALSDLLVRDSVLALALGRDADRAEQLWITMARQLPDPLRAVPATLLGFSTYARGEGPMAGVALGLALEADPDYSLALLLDGLLQAGIRPEHIREVGVTGFGSAALCGVTLPPDLQ